MSAFQYSRAVMSYNNLLIVNKNVTCQQQGCTHSFQFFITVVFVIVVNTIIHIVTVVIVIMIIIIIIKNSSISSRSSSYNNSESIIINTNYNITKSYIKTITNTYATLSIQVILIYNTLDFTGFHFTYYFGVYPSILFLLYRLY